MPHDTSCNVCDTLVPATSAPVFVKDGFEIVRCPRCDLLFRRDAAGRRERGRDLLG